MKMLLVLFLLLASVPVTATAGAQAQIPEGTTCYRMQPIGLDRADLLCIVTDVRPDDSEPPEPTPVTPTSVPTTPTTTPAPATATPVPTPVSTNPLRIVPDQFPTINAALAGIPANGTVVLRSGTYRESIVIRTAGVTLMAAPGETAWLDGECTRSPVVQILANDVKVRGLSIKRSDVGILVNGESNTILPARTIIDGNTIQDYNCADVNATNSAISAYYTGPGLKVTNNKITRRVTLPGPPAGFGTGIWFKSSNSVPSGGGHLISGNTILGGWDGIGGEEEYSSRGTFDRDTIIEKNVISSCGDDGIQVEGGGQNIFVQDNTISECGIGIAFATPLTGPLTVQRNKIVSSTVGMLGSHACFKAGNTTSSVIIVKQNDCTITGPGGSGFQQTNEGSGVWQLSGNNFRINGYMFQIGYTLPAPGSSFDGDCFEQRDSSRFIKWPGNVQILTLAAFQARGYERLGRLGPC